MASPLSGVRGFTGIAAGATATAPVPFRPFARLFVIFPWCGLFVSGPPGGRRAGRCQAPLLRYGLTGNCDSNQRTATGYSSTCLEKIMNFDPERQIRRASPAVLCGLLALSLSACDRDISPKQAGRDLSRSADKAGEQARKMMNERTADAGAVIDDATVTLRVKAALLAEPGLDSLQLHVETAGGVVTLTGAADTAANREKAAHVVLNVEGVTAVHNYLAIRGST